MRINNNIHQTDLNKQHVTGQTKQKKFTKPDQNKHVRINKHRGNTGVSRNEHHQELLA